MTEGDWRHGAALAVAAAGLVGIPFRLHGRNPATGLDCVGVVAAALSAIGALPIAPSGYALRNLSVDKWLDNAEQSGLSPASGAVRDGDVLLIALAHCQHHLAIAMSGATVVHAHAGLRRVVQQPLQPDWPVVARWRVSTALKD